MAYGKTRRAEQKTNFMGLIYANSQKLDF